MADPEEQGRRQFGQGNVLEPHVLELARAPLEQAGDLRLIGPGAGVQSGSQEEACVPLDLAVRAALQDLAQVLPRCLVVNLADPRQGMMKALGLQVVLGQPLHGPLQEDGLARRLV